MRSMCVGVAETGGMKRCEALLGVAETGGMKRCEALLGVAETGGQFFYGESFNKTQK